MRYQQMKKEFFFFVSFRLILEGQRVTPVPFMYSLLGAGYVQEIKGGCIIMGNAPSLPSGRYHLNFHSSNVILFPFRTKQRSIVPVIFV